MSVDIGFLEDFVLQPQKRRSLLEKLQKNSKDYINYAILTILGEHEDMAAATKELETLLQYYETNTGDYNYMKSILKSLAYEGYTKDPKAAEEEYITVLKNIYHPALSHSRVNIASSKNEGSTIYKSELEPHTFDVNSSLLDKNNPYNLYKLIDEKNVGEHGGMLPIMHCVDYPDHPKILEQIIWSLKNKRDPSFSLSKFTLVQLDKLRKNLPDVINNGSFVQAYIQKLTPPHNIDVSVDVEAKEKHLNTLKAFTCKLSHAFIEYHLAVVFELLKLKLDQEIIDEDLFLEYIKVPKNDSITFKMELDPSTPIFNFKGSPPYFPGVDISGFNTYGSITVIKKFLVRFYKDKKSYKKYFDSYLEADFLKRCFHKSKLYYGTSKDIETYSAEVKSNELKSIKEKKFMKFEPSNKKFFLPNEEINLKLKFKNIDKITVKVYELNTHRYYRDNKSEIQADISLDGLVPNQETSHTFEESSFTILSKDFSFPLSQRGVYAIEFISSDLAIRALVRKGRLSFVQDFSQDGHLITVLDENKKPLKGAKIWMNGHHYEQNGNGIITIPYTAYQTTEMILISDKNGFTSLESFNHLAEDYKFTSSFYIDRENLLSLKKATLLVKPTLYLNDRPVTLEALEDVTLTIRTVNMDGIDSSKEVKNFKLDDDSESTFTFVVPDRLSKVEATLTSTTKKSIGGKLYFNASQDFEINQIDKQLEFKSLFLRKGKGGYCIDALGKNGEPLVNEVLSVRVQYSYYTSTIDTTLATNTKGTAFLGPLEDANFLHVNQSTFNLKKTARSLPEIIHALHTENIKIPYEDSVLTNAEVAFYEVHKTYALRDCFKSLKLSNGYVHIEPMPAGSYIFVLKKANTKIEIYVEQGTSHSNWIFGSKQLLECSNNSFLQLNVEKKKTRIKIHLHNFSSDVRVHVIGNVFHPDFSLEALGESLIRRLPSEGKIRDPETTYMSRVLGEEYKYVNDRRYLEPKPGNTLTRPSLLLYPRALESTKTNVQEARGGRDKLHTVASTLCSHKERSKRRASRASHEKPLSKNNLDFMQDTSVCLFNLVPNKDGIVRVDLKKLGSSTHIQILVIQEQDYLYKNVALTDEVVKSKDVRLDGARALSSKKHYTEQKEIVSIEKNQSYVIKDVSSSKYELYDSLSRIFSFYTTSTNNPTLAEFSWIMNWPNMSDKDKAEKYEKFACHELNFFLYKKDPTYFDAVIKPYLNNKLQKTFLDHYFINADLEHYLEPHKFSRLNVFEKILLAGRLENQALLKSIVDHANTLNVEPDTFKHLFEIGLKGNDLDEPIVEAMEEMDDDAYSEEFEMGDQEESFLSYRNEMSQPMPPPPAPEQSMPQSAPHMKAFGMVPRSVMMVESPQKKKVMKKERLAPPTPLYQDIETTKVYAETNYYNMKNSQPTVDLIQMSKFWGDYANCKNEDVFVSKNFINAKSNFTELMFALSVMNFPLKPTQAQVDYKNVEMKITPKESSAILFLKDVRESEYVQTPLIVSQMFFDPQDKYTVKKGSRIEKYVEAEFLFGKIYGCDTIITNISSSYLNGEILLQIPMGAIPVSGGSYTKTEYVQLQPFTTQRKTFYFYFPTKGTFTQYPAHFGEETSVLAYATPATFNVVESLSKHDVSSWNYISQMADDKTLLEYLKNDDIYSVDMTKIAWRLQSLEKYKKIIQVLESRHFFNQTLWGYAFLHKDIPNIEKYIASQPNLSALTLSKFDVYAKFKTFTCDPLVLKLTEHLEYWPIVNARAHKLGNETKIMNQEFSKQYEFVLTLLAKKRKLEPVDYLQLSYYMALQDRFDLALELFKKTKEKKKSSEFTLLKDYMTCYLDFFKEYPKKAKKIAEKYVNYPVLRWEKLFANVRSQIQEIESGTKNLVDVDNRDQKQGYLTATSASLDMEISDDTITLNYQNVNKAKISYYKMDIELLFSTSPFVQNNIGYFAYIQPNLTTEISLDADSHIKQIPIPNEFLNCNIMVDISSNEVSTVKPYFSHSLFVSVIDKFGQVRVCDKKTGKPVPKAYVKVYAKHKNDDVKFYKDGYTDLRGGFDYTSLNTPDLDTTVKFSILIISPSNGTRIVEANPPKR